MMNKRNERMEQLVNAGVNTNKYFTFELPEGLEPGAEIAIAIIDGKPQVVNKAKENPVYNNIIEDGYVRNTKLHRRWVMAQMFRMLNYKSYDGRKTGYNEALKRYGFKNISYLFLFLFLSLFLSLLLPLPLPLPLPPDGDWVVLG